MYSTPVHYFQTFFSQSWNVFPFFPRSWSELTDIWPNGVRVNELKLYRHEQIKVCIASYQFDIQRLRIRDKDNLENMISWVLVC